ncbi:hypothetical protein PAXRUDRAFT_737104 [Paxillus rubicundulus Ve08.2h10]|uniref:GH3 auxin-responsive promoter n=1 Tax=Paxillus rubicundulus Ve08.2h10 TaxID=930991 RepID=A0A0D0DJT6_9AGAM|nr:hypothetical protein PAXRUDRAFT_737104 [Paxillus rubicundulus Ve08.2h10]
MNMIFLNTFVDMLQYIDEEFDMLVGCIERGIIPDLEGLAQFRCHLEVNFTPDPDRASELRAIGRPSARLGWCGRVWPQLRKIAAIASGSFATSVPQARWFLGPNVDIHSQSYGASEGLVGLPYEPLDLNQFKVLNKEVIEFLDVTKDESSALTQAWEVVVGKRYEIIMTTENGLWRYRLGDVVQVCGFDPRNGTPIISFVERRGAAMRFSEFMTTEKEITDAMASAAPGTIGGVLEFAVAIDARKPPATYGFLVELSGDLGPEPDLASQKILDALIESNPRIQLSMDKGKLRKPTIRIVEPGTFREFRQWKLEKVTGNLGQIKVPVVLNDAESVEWISKKVVDEF